ncbi:hypothetical protein C1645_839856 [Glomus cerebriforme]|uniref:Uncharacterized protein n=1 Tax=Glomus cerebriforme TaxID=658196 RepID=A0A397S500_9GLOM|nr:hypothetical protein C1645_839856 [Glomus cerebriforme]
MKNCLQPIHHEFSKKQILSRRYSMDVGFCILWITVVSVSGLLLGSLLHLA